MRSKIFYLFIFICVTRMTGFVLFPLLLKESPLLLIVLSPFLHHLILTSTLLSPPVFLVVGILISLFQCSVGYEFGKKHGMTGLEWATKKGLISSSKTEIVFRWIRSSAPFVLFLIPGPLIAMAAGVSQLRSKIFYTVMILSQITWIFGCLLLGTELDVYLKTVKVFVTDHWIALTCLLLFLKAMQTWPKKISQR